MSKSSSSTRREVQQLGKQEMQYGALKEQVLSQAPTSDYKNAKSEDEKLDMAVQYRKYMNGGFLDFHEVDEFHKGPIRVKPLELWLNPMKKLHRVETLTWTRILMTTT